MTVQLVERFFELGIVEGDQFEDQAVANDGDRVGVEIRVFRTDHCTEGAQLVAARMTIAAPTEQIEEAIRRLGHASERVRS